MELFLNLVKRDIFLAGKTGNKVIISLIFFLLILSIIPFITLQGSPVYAITETDTTFVPFTLQTTNALNVQALLTLSVDTDGFGRQK